MSFSGILARAYPFLLAQTVKPDDGPVVLFFSVSRGTKRAKVFRAAGKTFQRTWQEGAQQAQKWVQEQPPGSTYWLRIDQVKHVEATSWSALASRLARTKRNYFRFGLALDADLKHAFLEHEINANAMLYLGAKESAAGINQGNFQGYAARKFGKSLTVDFSPDETVYVFSHEGVFISDDSSLDGIPHHRDPVWLPGPQAVSTPWKHATSLNSGRRQIATLTADQVYGLIDRGAEFLSHQVTENGKFVYGRFPCFNREVPAYNSLRHASSLYSMLEAWELTRSDTLLAAIDRALFYLKNSLIQLYRQADGVTLAYNVEGLSGEIKLGANAVSLLAFVKYDELTGDSQYRDLMEQLALGIVRMQDPEKGSFVHVLEASDLSLKEAFRIVYYDGEAAFGLMRLYGLTKDHRWLAAVQKAFDHFIRSEHWKHHDHWLSYCANELTLYVPEEKYFRFGVQNVAGLLDFILTRETTYPTLLELCMAFDSMLRRIQNDHPEILHVLDGLDIDKFYKALHYRAHYLLNGFFWPELAMFYANPSSIVGSFFIRHHAFRVRIDDVEHYLSGYVAYWKMLSETTRSLALSEGKVKGSSAVETEASSSKNKIRISIVVPMYNREDKISVCLDSIARQSLSEDLFEVIVVDDGSTDGSLGVVRAYKKIKNLRLVVLERNSGGASRPRNVGIEQAVGDYILFIDSDDFITEDALLCALNLATDNDLDMVVIPIRFGNDRRAYTTLFDEYPQGIAYANLRVDKRLGDIVFVNPGIVGRLYKSAVLKGSGVRFSEKLRVYEDTLFSRFVYCLTKTFGMIDPRLAHYSPSRASGADNLSSLRRNVERCVLYVSEALLMCDQIDDKIIDRSLKIKIINNSLCRDSIYNKINNEKGYRELVPYVNFLLSYMPEAALREKAKELIRKVCREKTFQEFVLCAKDFFGASGPAQDLATSLRKVWVWRDRTLVIDFDFNGLRVGVDIDPVVDGYQSVDLVLRVNESDFKIDWSQYGKKQGRRIHAFFHSTSDGILYAFAKIADIMRSLHLEVSRRT